MIKRLSFLLISLSLVACTTTAPRQQEGGITFVHLNDTYRVGAVEDGKAGGFSRVVTIVRELQRKGRDVRILHGGDFLYPSLESQLWHGLQIVDAFNFMDDIAPLVAEGGFIPLADGRVRPDVSHENYVYYRELLQKVTHGH